MAHGFEIAINDRPPIRAGLDGDKYVVTCILDAIRRGGPEEELNITVGGLNSIDDVHVDWLKTELQSGDVIRITVVDGNYDVPCNTRPRMTEKEIIAEKLKYFYFLREELKEHLKE